MTDLASPVSSSSGAQADTQEGLTLALIGATGAVGSDLLATLHRSALPIRELRLLAGAASAGQTVDVEGQPQRVHALQGDPRESPLLEGVDLVFLAVPPDQARDLGWALAESGVMVIDIGGALADRAPLVVPALGLHALPEAARARLVCSPSAATAVVGTVVGALRQLGPMAARGTCLLSAGAAGRAGVDELSGQVVAMLNSKDPPRRVFPSGLAFDLHTSVGAVGAVGASDQAGVLAGGSSSAGWTPGEQRLASEVSVLTDLQPSRIAVGLAIAPIFSGVAAALHVELEQDVSLDDVRACLAGCPTVRVTDKLPGTRRLVGRAGLYIGRLRADPAGCGIHLWAVADNLRFAGSGNAIAIATALWQEGLL